MVSMVLAAVDPCATAVFVPAVRELYYKTTCALPVELDLVSVVSEAVLVVVSEVVSEVVSPSLVKLAVDSTNAVVDLFATVELAVANLAS